LKMMGTFYTTIVLYLCNLDILYPASGFLEKSASMLLILKFWKLWIIRELEAFPTMWHGNCFYCRAKQTRNEED